METAEPVSSYDFPGHVGSFPRRMESSLYPYYSHSSTPSYSLPYHTPPTTTPYHYGGPLSQPSHPYGHYMVASQPPLTSPVRLNQPPLHSLPEIRPAKNAINQVLKSVDTRETSLKKPSGSSIEFSTEVDVLMKAIQAKPETGTVISPIHQSLPPLQHLAAPGGVSHISSSHVSTAVYDWYRAVISIREAKKSFAQKTHLDIHTRAHTGDKPFICKEPSCGQRFSQLGNLKTHERRHTGEKPYSCDICHKTFAQRGNVRAHKTTHLQNKPFTCLLDDCGKKFTQLGNLKSHQNKFHASTIRSLTLRFSQPHDHGAVNAQDRELWEYFASLYKNSNKGIKGRGKDRRILTTKRAATSDTLHRMASMESEDDLSQQMQRRGSYDQLSMYTGASSDGDESGSYYMDRRGQH
ncbi:uncharacterized protein N7483_012244 [Penicillium malachiteum]|uniref:uncharacterized protein n=1 Tax=Penicillium malachiteum TaxID=1324776 RepID=UPI0025498562|nr:uncharacterized protein N7483_012244 [Penicillium malachiteum]KAJ5715063.1 hypothetical protein N7483_012244 [Penicillium malachiteum]